MRRILLLGTLSLLAVWVFLLAAGRCYPLMKPPARDCPIESLVLDASMFPPGGAAPFPPYEPAGPIQSPLPQGGYESAGRSIYILKGIANHDIRRYVTKELANRVVRGEKEAEFSPGMGGPWSVPDELTYRSPIADQYYLGCGIETNIYMCKLIAQYEEYYVFFNVHMTPRTPMTFSHLARVLRAIDERMAQCLGKALPIETPALGTR